MASYVYDAWGNHEITLNTNNIANINPIRYRSYYYDTETGLYYLQTRYYDPQTGRFINADTTDVITTTITEFFDKNLYAYCDNNPVARKDDGGEIWNILIGATVGAVVGAVVEAATQLIDDPDSWKTGEFWGHVGIAAGIGAISGGLAASGAGLASQVVTNAVLGAASATVNAAIDGEKKVSGYISKATEGAVFGAIGGRLGGKGTASKHITNSFKRVINNGNWSYYFSQINTQAVRDGVKSISSILKATLPNVLKTSIKAGVKYG